MSTSLDRHLQRGWSIFNPELDEFIFEVPPQFRLAGNWYRGTADAIFQNIDILERERPDRVLILGRRPRVQNGLQRDARLSQQRKCRSHGSLH